MIFSKRSPLPKWQKIIDSCQACGQCEAVCPLCQASNSEAYAARAKIATLKAFMAGRLSKEDTEKFFSICLHCGKCDSACPAGLPLHKIFSEVSRVFPKKGFCLNLLNLLQSFPKLRRSAQFINYIVVRIVKKNNFYQPTAGCSLKALYSQKTKLKKTELPPILLYSGCLAMNVDPDIAVATKRFAESTGYNVLTPALPCCGRQNRLNGREAEYTHLVRKNLKILSKFNFEYILSPCPACFKEIAEYWPNLQGISKEEAAFAASLKEKLLDPTDLFYRWYRENKRTIPENISGVLFHLSCLSQKNTPKLLKEFFPTGNFLENESNNCCGASLLNSLQPADAQRILASKLASNLREQILRQEAAKVLTNCPACKLQLKKTLKASEKNCELYHIAEFYAELFPPS